MDLSWLEGYRKLFVAILVVFLSLALLLTGVLSGDQFVEIIKFVIPSFMAANLAEYILDKKGKAA